MSNGITDETKRCPKCGQPLAGQAMGGLCPNCLVQVTFGEDSQATGGKPPLPDKTVVIPKTPPSPLDSRPSTPSRIRYFGDYELLEEIARGGMGVVYKARQVSLNRVVAVKMILAGQLASEAEVKRFRTEAEAAANLQHPSIVSIHEVGMHEGQHYFSMDYVEGKNLAEVVRTGPLSARQAATFVKTMAEAIQYAHQRGIFHRDLKPSNVLIDTSEKPRITDFGLAKVAHQDSGLTQIGTVIGTPAYMSPEQAVGRHDQIGPPSDVYSLGAILYELLTGRPPFQAETFHDTLRQVVQNEPDSVRKLNSAVPIDLETICLKCLEKQPQRRYGSARTLADELECFLNGQAITACPPPRWRKLWIWSRHHPWAISGSLSVLVLFLLSMTYGFWELNQYTLSLFSGGQKDDQTLTIREIFGSPDKMAGKNGGETFLIVCGNLLKGLLGISYSLIRLFGFLALLILIFVYRRLFDYHRAKWRLGQMPKGWTLKDYWKYGAALVFWGVIQIQGMIHGVVWEPFDGDKVSINLILSCLYLWLGFNLILLSYREVDTSYHGYDALGWSEAAQARKNEQRRSLVTLSLLFGLVLILFFMEYKWCTLVISTIGVFFGFVAEYFLCLPDTRQKQMDLRVKVFAIAVGCICLALCFIYPIAFLPWIPFSGPLGFGMGFNLANLLRLKSNANPQVPVITTMNESPP